MDCPNCAGKVESAIKRLPGVSDVHVSTITQILTLQAGQDLPPDSIERTLAAIAILPPAAAPGDGLATPP